MNPKVFKIIDSKLYLNWDEDGAAEFEAEAADNIKKADDSWDKHTKKK